MKVKPVTVLMALEVTIGADEARELYAELYRLSSDVVMKPYPADSQIAELMRRLGEVGVDS